MMHTRSPVILFFLPALVCLPLFCGGAWAAASAVDRGLIGFGEGASGTAWSMETKYAGPDGTDRSKLKISFGVATAVPEARRPETGVGVPWDNLQYVPMEGATAPTQDGGPTTPDGDTSIAGGGGEGVADACAPAPTKPEASIYQDLQHGMLAISPDEFIAPVREVPMSLRQVAASVLKNNRTIQVASFKPEQSRADIMTAKSVYDPEAFASWTHTRTDASAAMIISGVPSPNREFRNETTQTGVRQHLPSGGQLSAYHEWNSGIERSPGADADCGHGSAYVIELSQPLLNGFLDAENRASLEISRIQYDMSNEEFRQTIIETMSDAMEAYWTAAMGREEIRINQASLDMAERLLAREEGRKEEGISNELDVNRAREAAATRAYNLVLSKEQYLQAQEDLKYKINDKSAPVGMDVFIDASESLEMPLMKVDIEKVVDSALQNRPEMRNADLAIRYSATRKRFAKHSLLPELNLVGQVRRNDQTNSTPMAGSTTANTGTDWTVGLQFSMPIGNMKNRASLRKANAELSGYVEEKKNARDMIITEIRSIGKSLEMVVREIPLNRRAMEAAAKVLEGEWAKLELNQTGNRDLLQAQDLVAVAEKNYIQSLIRYNVYIVRLLAAEGMLLDKMGIKLRSM